MKVKIYSIFDRKASVFNQPFFAMNDVQAQRSVYMREKVEPSQLSEFPDDFMLVYIGEFDHHSGDISGLDHKFDAVCELRSLLRVERSE